MSEKLPYQNFKSASFEIFQGVNFSMKPEIYSFLTKTECIACICPLKNKKIKLRAFSYNVMKIVLN